MGRTSARVALALALALALGLASVNASAYCRTTTCDASGATEDCAVDGRGCATRGKPLYWAERCLSFGVQEDGSPKRNIPYAAFDRVIQVALKQWISADCGGGTHPSYKIWDLDAAYGPIVCAEPEFNQRAPNANVFMFRDADWPYVGAGSTLAVTTLTFEAQTGQILDVDVDVNSFSGDLTTSDLDVRADLQSIVTHEAGHFLGLGHSDDPTATMHSAYSPGDLSFRSLGADDQAGICAAYPPDRSAPACSAPEPRHGFSRYCSGGSGDAAGPGVKRSGCSTAAGTTRRRAPSLLLVGVAALVLRRRRERRDGVG